MLFHWWFNGKLRDVNDKVDSFIVDVINIFARNLDSSAINNTPVMQNTQPNTQQMFSNQEIKSNSVNINTTTTQQEVSNDKDNDDNEQEIPKAKPAKKAKPVDDDI